MENDTSNNGQNVRIRAVELAISEIAAYKESHLAANYTEKLILSARAITDYILEGKLPLA
jgi:hypothetical protein